jgi:uncharacterized membrane protein
MLDRPAAGRSSPVRRIAKDFLKGLLVVVPVVTTIYLVWLPVTFFDELVMQVFPELEETPVVGAFPGIGLVVTAVGIWAIGVLASNRLGERFLWIFERLLKKVPILKPLYQTVKDVVSAFVGDERKFDRPVCVDLIPGQDVKALGFITRSELDQPGLEGRIAVYLPQSYNIAGNLIVVPRDRVTPLEVDPGRFMTLIMSGGVTGSESAPEGEG